MLKEGQARGPAGGELPAPPSRPVVARLVARVRTPRPPILFLEMALIGVFYVVYSTIRNAVPEQAGLAISRAWDLLRFEQTLHIDIELWFNQAVNSVTWLVVAMNYFYATMHFIVTIGVLVWLYRWHPGRYRPMRTALVAATALALLGYFLVALAPPRLLPGTDFIDTVAVHNTWGSMASGDLQSLSNQFAAMPSMHAGWSLWCGLAIFVFARNKLVKVAGALYPVATLAVIVGTANHFVLDAVAGWLTLALGFGIQFALHGQRALTAPRLVRAPSRVPAARVP